MDDTNCFGFKHLLAKICVILMHQGAFVISVLENIWMSVLNKIRFLHFFMHSDFGV